MRHGPNGALFLDPYFIPELTKLKNHRLLDVGCGAGPWSIHAAKHGAIVSALDIQEKMIFQAMESTQITHLTGQINYVVGEAAMLPYSNDYFDTAISINVGCNLPSTPSLKYFPNEIIGLGAHIDEMARTLKVGGTVIVTAPASFEVVFTDGTDRDLVMQHIDEVLEKINIFIDPVNIVYYLNELTEVHRATFAMRDGKLALIQSLHNLTSGEEIWRKIPGLTVLNYYHPEMKYVKAFESAGLSLERIERPKFENAKACQEHADLGNEYIENHPFAIFHLSRNLH